MSIIKSFRFWIGILVSLLFLWLAVRGIPIKTMGTVISSAAYFWLIPAVVAQIMAVLARSQRWIVLLKKPKRFTSSLMAQGIGYLFTNILPFRLGEPARILVMAEQCDQPPMFVAGTAVVERLLDVATIIMALTLVLPWIQIPVSVSNAGFVFGMLVLFGLAIIILMARFPQKARTIVKWLLDLLPFLPDQTLLRWWDDFIKSLTVLLNWGVAVKVVLWSLISWAFSACVYFCVIRAFHPDGLMLEAVFMMVALSLAVTLPSSPGFIGVFQFAGQQALIIPFGVKYNSSSALMITLTAHLVYYLLTTGLGLIAIWATGTSFSKMTRSLFGRKN